MEAFATKLESLKFEPMEWRLEPSETLVADFEKRFALRLPVDYREFLLNFGGCFGSGCSPVLEPTPFGETAVFDGFYGFMPKDYGVYGVEWGTQAFGDAQRFIAIAPGSWGGCMVVLKCVGRDTGSVYFYDTDQRSLWSDDQFYQMFPNLSPVVVSYLELRRKKQLPKKPSGYESLYLLGKSFTEFFYSLEPDPDYTDE